MIKICIPRDKDEITKGKRPKELHKLIQERTTGQVAAIQVLPSGDIQVITRTKLAKKTLIKDDG